MNADGSVKSTTVSEHVYSASGLSGVTDPTTLSAIQNTESDAAFIDDVFCQYMENAAGRTFLPDYFITVYCRQYFQRSMFFSWVQYVACLLAQAALDAVRHIYVRVQEALIVRNH